MRLSSWHPLPGSRNAVSTRGAKDRHPLPELQIGCDDNAGLLIELADEVEQQRPARFRERDVPQLINDHTIHLGKLPDDFIPLPGRRRLAFAEKGHSPQLVL